MASEPTTGWQPGYVTITLAEDQARWMLDDDADFPAEQQNLMAEGIVRAVRLAARQRYISAEALRHQMLTDMHKVLEAERADLALALELLNDYAAEPENCDGPECCIDSRAHALLVRHGIRQEPTACPDSSLLAWGLHEVDPDGRWQA